MKDKYGIEYSISDFMKEKNDKKIIIFGAGRYGKQIYHELTANGLTVFAFCDNNKKNNNLFDLPIMKISEISSVVKYYFIISVAANEAKKLIKYQLVNAGVPFENIVIPIPLRKTKFYDERLVADDEFRFAAIGMQWRYQRNNNRHIQKYFESNELYKIILYEYDEFTDWIDVDFKNSKVTIVQKINSVKDKLIDDYDAILVLDEKNFEFIEDTLMCQSKKPVISIWEVIK